MAGAFFATGFFAGVFLATGFLAEAFLAGAFRAAGFATAFFAAGFLAVVALLDVDFFAGITSQAFGGWALYRMRQRCNSASGRSSISRVQA